MPVHYEHFGTYWVLKPYIYTSPYFVLAAIAAITGIVTAYFEMKRRKLGNEKKHTILSSVIIYLFLVAFARILYFLGPWSWKEYPTWASRFMGIFSMKAGMVFYGGLVGALLGLYIYTKIKTKGIKKLDFWEFADIWAPSGGLILFFGRIGCYTAGCCAGKISNLNLPWLIERNGSIIHPTQLYSSLLGLLVFVAMTELKYRQGIKKLFHGYVVLWGILLYSVGRFFVEFFRYYDLRFWGLSPSQLTSIGLVVLCSLVICIKKPKHQNIYK